MKYRLLGRSGLRVSELALGTMTFGEDWGWGAPLEESRRIFDAFTNAGGNFIDTACNYTEGTSEKYVGELIATDRDYFVVATKYTLRPNQFQNMDPNRGGNARKNMIREVEASLQRLGSDYIDLLYLHMWDYTTPVEEIMRAADDLVRAGKILYFGMSDTPAYIMARANMYARCMGLSPVVATQVPYNLARRDPEREIMPMASEEDIAVTCWGLVMGGVLTGKYRSADTQTRYEKASKESMDIGDGVVSLAEEIGHSPAQIAVNWVRQQQSKAQVIPILGARTHAQMEENLGALDFELTSDQLEKIDSLIDFDPGFPRSFLHSDNVRNLVHGKTYDSLENHRF